MHVWISTPHRVCLEWATVGESPALSHTLTGHRIASTYRCVHVYRGGTCKLRDGEGEGIVIQLCRELYPFCQSQNWQKAGHQLWAPNIAHVPIYAVMRILFMCGRVLYPNKPKMITSPYKYHKNSNPAIDLFTLLVWSACSYDQVMWSSHVINLVMWSSHVINWVMWSSHVINWVMWSSHVINWVMWSSRVIDWVMWSIGSCDEVMRLSCVLLWSCHVTVLWWTGSCS